MGSKSFHIPDQLVADVAEGRTIAYLGAGFTAACGMPGWGGLLRNLISAAAKAGSDVRSSAVESHSELVDSANLALSQGRYVLCASLIRSLLREMEIRDLVRRSFSSDVYRNASPVQKDRMKKRCLNIFRTPFRGIITTNYDTIIEDLWPKFAPKRFETVIGGDPQLGHLLFSSARARPFFFKAHGSLDSSSIVLSTEEYDRVYLAVSTTRRFLEAAMMTSSFLFVGCSLEDELLRIRRGLLIEFSGKLPLSYALVEMSPENQARADWLLRTCAVQSVYYVNRNGAHSKVDEFLEQLCVRATGQAAQSFGASVPLTAKEHLSLNLPQRLKGIGFKNEKILGCIRSSPDKQVNQDILLSMLQYSSDLQSAGFSDFSAEEFFYRVMFLIQIGLLREERDHAGRRFYILEDGVARHVSSAKAGVDAPSPSGPSRSVLRIHGQRATAESPPGAKNSRTR